MGCLIILGIISLILGLMLLVSPKSAYRFEEEMNKISIMFKEKCYNLTAGMGISLILISLLCFLVAYYLVKKYGC